MNPFIIAFVIGVILLIGLYIYDLKRPREEVGSVVITRDPETQKILFSLEMDCDPADLMEMNEVVFIVENRL